MKARNVTWPAEITEMIRGGYRFISRVKCGPCPNCGEEIRLFRTPMNRIAPFVVLVSGKLVSHYAICPRAKEKKKEAAVTQTIGGKI
jgi:hypothetical protein